MPSIGPQLVNYALQIAIGGIFFRSIHRRNATLAVNAGGALFVSMIPYLVGWIFHIHVGWLAVFWTTIAGLLHILGTWRLYVARWWWDHLTHTVSGGLVAAISYAIVVDAVGSSNTTTAAIAGFVVVFVLGWEIFWELLEYISQRVSLRLDASVMLTQDGTRDGVLDLWFNLLGACIVLVVPGITLIPLVRRIPVVNEKFLRTVIRIVIGIDLSLAVIVGIILLFEHVYRTAERD
jgi:glycopeptide antibiotics resistance protein